MPILGSAEYKSFSTKSDTVDLLKELNQVIYCHYSVRHLCFLLHNALKFLYNLEQGQSVSFSEFLEQFNNHVDEEELKKQIR